MHAGLRVRSHRILLMKYSASQPRYPKGHPQGGQWKPAGAGMSPMHDLVEVQPTPEEEPFDYENPPKEYEGVAIMKSNLPPGVLGRANLWSEPEGEARIRLTSNSATKAQYGDLGSAMAEFHSTGFMSSDHSNHIVWHELAHVRTMQSMDQPSFNELRAVNEFSASNPDWASVAVGVSTYASVNGAEFVAEVYAGKRAGRTFSPEVDSLYRDMLSSTGNGALLNDSGREELRRVERARVERGVLADAVR